jgi:hypothetical protein
MRRIQLLLAGALHTGVPVFALTMAAPADYLDADDLKDVLAGGMIREDVLDEIFDNSEIPCPFLDMIAEDSHDNSYAEWTEDKLAAPDLNNKRVSGADSSTANNKATTANMKRVGNHGQISAKDIMVTERGNAVDTVALGETMGYQTARRTIELRYDVEAIALSGQGSVLDDGDTIAGQSAGAAAWITTNKNLGAGGTATGFNTGTKLVAAQLAGAERGLTMTMVTDQIQNVYVLGGETTILMSVPGVTKRFSRYLFTTVDAAKPTAEVGATTPANLVSQGYIDVFRTDFGFTMEVVPNRLQQTYLSIGVDPDPQVANVFGFDPRYWGLSMLYGWKVDALGKAGLSHKKLVHGDWMLKAYLERANFNIGDIDPTVAVVA